MGMAELFEDLSALGLMVVQETPVKMRVHAKGFDWLIEFRLVIGPQYMVTKIGTRERHECEGVRDVLTLLT